MSANDQFSRYRAMLTELAQGGLSPQAWLRMGPGPADANVAGRLAANASTGAMSLALAAPAARLLLRDDRADHAGLVAAFQRFADLGRPHLTVGVNVGTLAAKIGRAHV